MDRNPESITLEDGDTTATIAPQRGAIVTSLRVSGRELLYLDRATLDDVAKNVRGGIPILFPSPGKLENDRWQCSGRAGEMRQHGFARNLPWTVERPALERSRISLLLESDDATLRAYPWRFKARLTCSVEPNALVMRFAIMNQDAAPLPFALGLHPYFIVPDKSRARIQTPATRAFDNVAKQLVPFSGFDLTRGEVDIHLLDHGSAAARLELGECAITLDCSEQFTRWVVWTLPDKEFICLEPWSAPGNALNTGEGVIVLAPGEQRELWARISMLR